MKEKQALATLNKRNDPVLKPSEKGGNVVVMDKTFYYKTRILMKCLLIISQFFEGTERIARNSKNQFDFR